MPFVAMHSDKGGGIDENGLFCIILADRLRRDRGEE